MAVHALTEVGVAPGRAREALWAAARLGRRLAERPGFQGMRVFRSEMDADSLMVLTEWAEWDAAEQAQAAAPILPLLERVRALCARWHSRRLESLFDVQFPRRKLSTGMAQALQVGALHPSRVPARQKEFGLRAMTLPGTLGVLGGRCVQDPCFYFCAVEFDSDDALIDFAGSATRQEWAKLGASTWWRKDPRLEVRVDRRAGRVTKGEEQAETLGSLNVRIERSPDGHEIALRLHGRMDEAAAARFGRVRDAVLARGCRKLTLDVSGLTAVTTEGLNALLDTARRIKEAGGHLTLADRQGRFNHIVRVLHLNRVLTQGRDKAIPRRRVANRRFDPPGSA